MANTALPTRAITPAGPLPHSPRAPAAAAGGIEIAFRPDPTIFDGRFNNNGWLQELPKPLTHLTWDNAVLVSPATMARIGGTRAARLHGRRARADSRLGRRDSLSRANRARRDVSGCRSSGRRGDAAPRLRPRADGTRSAPSAASTPARCERRTRLASAPARRSR